MNNKLILAIIPVLICAGLIFFVKNWSDGLSTKAQVSETYIKECDADKKYATIKDKEKMAIQIANINEKVNEVHDDLKTLIMYFAKKDTSFNDTLKEKGFFDFKCTGPGKCEELKTAVAKNGG